MHDLVILHRKLEQPMVLDVRVHILQVEINEFDFIDQNEILIIIHNYIHPCLLLATYSDS